MQYCNALHLKVTFPNTVSVITIYVPKPSDEVKFTSIIIIHQTIFTQNMSSISNVFQEYMASQHVVQQNHRDMADNPFFIP